MAKMKSKRRPSIHRDIPDRFQVPQVEPEYNRHITWLQLWADFKLLLKKR